MKQKHYSVVPYWDKTAVDAKTKLSRVMLTVNNVGTKQFRITLKMRATKADFDKISSGRTLSEEAKQVRKEWNEYLLKAESILDRLDKPTKETFTRLFKSESDLFKNNLTDIAPFFKLKMAKLFLEERFSSSESYKLALSSFTKYKPKIHFEVVDKDFLKGYVVYMLGQGNSITTAHIYLRNLRSIFNEVINDGILSAKHYHFKGFKMGSSVRSKAVLYPEQLKALLTYETKNEKETKAIAYFFFLYLSNGMNFADAGLLQYKNLCGDMLTFERHKTRNTITSGAKEIRVYLHDLTKEIINQYGNKSKCPDDYVLGLVNDKMTAWDIQKTLHRHKKLSNKSLSKIGKELGFGVHLCLNLDISEIPSGLGSTDNPDYFNINHIKIELQFYHPDMHDRFWKELEIKLCKL